MTSPVLFQCITGPDKGKRVTLTGQDIVLGRSPQCNILSDDPHVADIHAILSVRNGRPAYRTVNQAAAYLDGHLTAEGALAPRQQLRFGRSIWEVAGGPPPGSLLKQLGEQISSAAGVERISGFNAAVMFSDVLKKRSDEDMEEYFNVGSPSTTPALGQVDANWPRPWAFFKTFLVSLVVYLGFVVALNEFSNPLLIPGLIIIGSFAIPFSILVFFYEMNVPRNVSLYQVMKLLLFGGILSLILSLFFFRWTGLSNWLGAMAAGIIEEAGKAMALLLVINKRRYRWILNGLLFGATIGTGFAVFESAGYAFLFGLQGGQSAMLHVITVRGVLSILGGHGLWTALVGAALWRVRGDRIFTREMLADPRFLRVFALAVGLHMVWNSPIELPFYLKHIMLGFVAWTAVLSFIHTGLKQVRSEQSTMVTTPMPAFRP